MTDFFAGDGTGLTASLAWVLVTFLWEAAVVGGLSWLALRLTASLRPKTRYALALALLGSLALLPAATIARLGATSPNDRAPTLSTTESPRSMPASVSTPPAIAPMERNPNAVVESRAFAISDAAPLRRVEAAWSATQQRLLAGIAPIGGAIVLLWLAGALLVATRFVLDLMVIRRLRRAAAIPLPVALASRVATLHHRLRLRSTVSVVMSSHVEVPLVLGVVSPLVLLPGRLVTAMDQRDIEMLVAHELAHVERRDYAVNIAQVVLEILFFFHPVTWWLSARVREEREHCCDARALEITDGKADMRKRYIAALLVAEEARSVAAPRLAPSASRGSLLRRAHEVLERGADEIPGARVYGMVAIVAATVGILLAAPQPSLASAKIGSDTNDLRPESSNSSAPTVMGPSRPTGFPIWRGSVSPASWLRVRNLVGDVMVERATGGESEVTAIGWRPGAPTPLSFSTTRQGDGVTVCAIRPGVECDEEGNIVHIAPSELYSDSATLIVRVPDGINLVVASSDGDLVVSGLPIGVQAQTGRGKITIRGASGSVEAATGGGTVRVENAAGDVVVRTSGGAVSLANVGGDIEVRASTGDIDAALDAGRRGRRWTFLTGSGSIGLRGRSLERAQIQVEATNGRVDSDFPYVRASRSQHRLLAESSPRSSVINASTSNGDISIKAMR